MSRIAPASHEPVEPERRKGFSWMVRDDVCASQDNLCVGPDCEAELYPWGLELDHILPLELGGSNDISNLQALCESCHKEKTRADIKRIAKARRLRKPRAPAKRSIPARPFDRTKTRTFSGKVRPRPPVDSIAGGGE